MSTTLRTLGQPVLRTEAEAKTRGATRYTADIRLEGALHAQPVLSPLPYARILNIDVTRALAVPGVLAVLTAQDLPDRLVGRRLKDISLLARDVVRFVGDRVAVVAAETREAAAEAVTLVDVEYDPLPSVVDPRAAMQPDAPLLHPNLEKYPGYEGSDLPRNACARQLWERGDLQSGFAGADLVLEATYTTHVQHQCFMEPRACQVSVAPDGKVTVWSANKAPFVLRNEIAAYTGLPAEQINVIATNVGGDFGGKGVVHAEPLCYYLALKTGRPIRYVLTREQELTAGTPRHGSRITLRAGVTKQGRIVAWDARVLFNAGAYAGHNVRIMPGGANRAVGPYNIPNVRVEALSVYTNVLHHGHMRGPGDPQTAFAVESHMDALARTLSMDAVEFRLLNAVGRDDPSPLGKQWRENHLRETIRLAAEAHKAAGPLPAAPPGFRVGTGLACAERYNGSGKSGARVRAEADGSVSVIIGVVDVGTGAPTLFRQIAAEVLSLPLEQVRVVLGDTDSAPYDQGVGSSRHTPVAGNAVRLAAEDLLAQLRPVAEEALECPPDLLEYIDGTFSVRGTPPDGPHRIPLRDLVKRASAGGANLPEGSAKVEMAVPPETCFAAAVADVAVDPGTGQIKVLRITSAHDVGRVLNPVLLRSQVEGALLQGVGYATTEELVWDESGQVITATLSAYGMPNSMDVPEVRAVWLEGAASPGPFGAKSVAEAALTPVAPAIANAVRAVTGHPVRVLPLSPERVLDSFHHPVEPKKV